MPKNDPCPLPSKHLALAAQPQALAAPLIAAGDSRLSERFAGVIKTLLTPGGVIGKGDLESQAAITKVSRFATGIFKPSAEGSSKVPPTASPTAGQRQPAHPASLACSQPAPGPAAWPPQLPLRRCPTASCPEAALKFITGIFQPLARA